MDYYDSPFQVEFIVIFQLELDTKYMDFAKICCRVIFTKRITLINEIQLSGRSYWVFSTTDSYSPKNIYIGSKLDVFREDAPIHFL